MVGLWAGLLLSSVLALLLSVVPFPAWMQWWRPEWLALVLIQWCLLMPERVGIVYAWIAGLMLDIVEGAPLGQNAIALSVMVYLVLILYQRLRMFTPWQQMGMVFVLVGLQQLLSHWVQTLTGSPTSNLLFLLPAMSSALCWPLLTALTGRFVRQPMHG